MKEKIKIYLEWLEKQKDGFKSAQKQLECEGRADEAILMKIRFNICDIFGKVIKVARNNAKRQGAEEGETFREEYLKLMERIPATWEERQGEARQYGDAITEAIEDVKLATANMLREGFLKVWAGEQP